MQSLTPFLSPDTGNSMSSNSNNMNKVSPEAVQKAFDARHYAKVIDLYNHANSYQKKRPNFLLIIGHSHYELGQYDMAIAMYRQILRYKIDNGIKRMVYYNRGMAFRELDRPAEAIKDFKRAGIIYDKAESLIGEMYYVLAESRPRYLALALKYLANWLRRHPSDGYSRYLIGACYNQLDNSRRALKHMLRCIEMGFLTDFVIRGVINELSATKEPEEIAVFFRGILGETNDSDGHLRSVVRENIAALIRRRKDPDSTPLPAHLRASSKKRKKGNKGQVLTI